MEDIEKLCENEISTIKDSFKLRYRMEFAEMQEAENQHIHSLIECQKEKYLDMQNFYRDIITNNLSLINNLKKSQAA